jgi:rubredoxin
MKKFRCPCGYIYDPDDGEPQYRIPPGTSFEDLPDDFICPRCGYEKEYFIEVKGNGEE